MSNPDNRTSTPAETSENKAKAQPKAQPEQPSKPAALRKEVARAIAGGSGGVPGRPHN